MLCSKGDKDAEQKKGPVAKPGNNAKATATLLFHYAFSEAKPGNKKKLLKAFYLDDDYDEDCDDLEDLLADAKKEEDKKKLLKAFYLGKFAASAAYLKELKELKSVYEGKKAAAAGGGASSSSKRRVKQQQWNSKHGSLKTDQKRSKALMRILED